MSSRSEERQRLRKRAMDAERRRQHHDKYANQTEPPEADKEASDERR